MVMLVSAIAVFIFALRSESLSVPETIIDVGVARIILNTVTIPLCPQQVPCTSGLPRPIRRISSGWIMLTPRAGAAPQMIKLFGVVQTDFIP